MRNKHGANLFELSRTYNFNIEEIEDFSSNINPFGSSEIALADLKEHLYLVQTYPDPEYKDLKEQISKYSKTQKDHIIIGSGTTALLSDYIALLKPERSLLLSPCYSEYEYELNRYPGTIHYYNLRKEKDFEIDTDELIHLIKKHTIELFILCNPNNPTGSILELRQIERILQETDCNIMIDETYIEFTDKKRYSATPLASSNPKLFVVRSTSKFFATPGIRLGYGVLSNEEHKNAIVNQSKLWGVNIFADQLGQTMFGDLAYQKQCYHFVDEQRAVLIEELKQLEQIKVYPSYGNFILCEILDKEKTAADLREYLLPQKMIIRDCSNFKNLDAQFFRFCILSEEANQKLMNGVRDFF